MASKFHCRLKSGLKQIGIDGDSMNENYVYCGGNDEIGEQYWTHVCKGETHPTTTNKCICVANIIKNKYIINREEIDKKKRILVIGSCCVDRFQGLKKRYCLKCGNDNDNKKVNICKICEKTICKLCLEKLQNGICMKCSSTIFGFTKINVGKDGNKYYLVNNGNDIYINVKKYILDKSTNNCYYVLLKDRNDVKKIRYIDNVLDIKAPTKNIEYKPMLHNGRIKVKYYGGENIMFFRELNIKIKYVWMSDGKMGVCPQIM